jgi:hypothetical protein
MAGKHIFISYRSTEFDLAYKFAQLLTQAGYPIWMDKLGGILPGMDWQKALESGVDEAFALVPLLSRNYLTSTWCEREYKRADIKRIPIIPAQIGDLRDVNMPMALQTTQYANLSEDSSFDAEFAKFLAGVQQLTGVLPGPSRSLPELNHNPYRNDPEDRMVSTEQEIAQDMQSSDLDELKALDMEELAKDISLVKKQYLAVRIQYRLMIDPALKVTLEGNIDHYYNEYKKLLERLENLRKG